MISFQHKNTKEMMMMMMMHRRRLHPQRLIKNTNPLFVIQLRAKSSGTQRRIGCSAQ